ncbi:MAG: ferrous iron transport protein B [Pyrinomonadaceae bacterium]
MNKNRINSVDLKTTDFPADKDRNPPERYSSGVKSNNKNSRLVVALSGNPNAGKTTLFNALTGMRQKVANYPGVTVERKEGFWKLDKTESAALLIDLPGLYSLDAASIDEQIARDVLTGKLKNLRAPDIIVAVVDATNLERNLYLVTQLLEYKIPVVVALTMTDSAAKQKIGIDIKKLSRLLKVPVIAVNASQKKGLSELSEFVLNAVGSDLHIPTELISSEEDSGNSKIFIRYNFISQVFQETIKSKEPFVKTVSEKIDAVLTHRFFGLIILVGILLFVFQAIFSWANVPMDLLERGFGGLGDLIRSNLSPGLLNDLLVDGVIAGVGGVLVFLPQILLLFLFLSLLEDTGYMARAAFLLDRLMRGVGLHGKAFVPLLSSFACAIPGIMATRTIEDRRDRLATILIAPFMSCSARLPVYGLMIATFFAGQTIFGFISLGAVLMLSMYALGIIVAVIVAFILKRTLLKSPPPPFVMELPPYRMPNFRTVFQNMFTRAGLFLKRAGTTILAISIILWGLTAFPRYDVQAANSEVQSQIETSASVNNKETSKTDNGNESADTLQLENSYAGKLGHFIEPVIRPLGFNWKIGVALIASFAAREVLVSTLSIIYNVGKDSNEESDTLIKAVREAKNDDGSPTWTPLTALTLMVFFVLALQCMSTVAVVRRETNSWGWALFMIGYMTAIAYFAAFITYQGGRFLGFS